MNEFNIESYAKSLLQRINEARIIKRELVNLGPWEAKPKMCHHNVTELHQFDERYKPVRGWLYFDLPGLDFVKFVSHSVIQKPSGELVDITPAHTPREYPFIESKLSDEEYAYLVDELGYTEINYKNIKGHD